MKAKYNGTLIAQSDETILLEGNHYFPQESVKMQYLSPSEMKSTCPWKGEASYYHVEVDGQVDENAAWYYPEPKDAAKRITGYIAFWHGVEIVE